MMKIISSYRTPDFIKRLLEFTQTCCRAVTKYKGSECRKKEVQICTNGRQGIYSTIRILL